MEQYEVIGLEDGSYLSKKDGLEHKGIRIHLKSDKMIPDKHEPGMVNPEGYSVTTEWISESVVKETGFIPSLGDHIKVFYTRWGTVGTYLPA